MNLYFMEANFKAYLNSKNISYTEHPNEKCCIITTKTPVIFDDDFDFMDMDDWGIRTLKNSIETLQDILQKLSKYDSSEFESFKCNYGFISYNNLRKLDYFLQVTINNITFGIRAFGFIEYIVQTYEFLKFIKYKTTIYENIVSNLDRIKITVGDIAICKEYFNYYVKLPEKSDIILRSLPEFIEYFTQNFPKYLAFDNDDIKIALK